MTPTDLRALADEIDADAGLGWKARLLCVAVLRGMAERREREGMSR